MQRSPISICSIQIWSCEEVNGLQSWRRWRRWTVCSPHESSATAVIWSVTHLQSKCSVGTALWCLWPFCLWPRLLWLELSLLQQHSAMALLHIDLLLGTLYPRPTAFWRRQLCPKLMPNVKQYGLYNLWLLSDICRCWPEQPPSTCLPLPLLGAKGASLPNP